MKRNLKKVGKYFLYGILFSSIAFISSLLQGKSFTNVIPTASADIPSGGDGTYADGGNGGGGSGGGACDSSGADAGCGDTG